MQMKAILMFAVAFIAVSAFADTAQFNTIVEKNITWNIRYISPAGLSHHDEPADTLHIRAEITLQQHDAPGRHVIKAYCSMNNTQEDEMAAEFFGSRLVHTMLIPS